MANSHLGEVSIELGGEQHVLCFDLNGLVELCERFGIERLDEMGDKQHEFLRPSNIRFLLALGLRGGSIPECTEAQAGRLVPMSSLKTAIDAVGEAFTAATRGLETVRAKADPPTAGG